LRVPQHCGFVIERTLHVDDILIFDVYYTGKQIITIFTVVVVVSFCRRCSCCYHSHYCDTYFEEQTKGVVHYYHWGREWVEILLCCLIIGARVVESVLYTGNVFY